MKLNMKVTKKFRQGLSSTCLLQLGTSLGNQVDLIIQHLPLLQVAAKLDNGDAEMGGRPRISGLMQNCLFRGVVSTNDGIPYET